MTAARCGSGRRAPRRCRARPATAAAAREPTVTDANLVLGRLGGDTRLGGELTLDAEAAARAIRARIAGPLGLDLVDRRRRHPARRQCDDGARHPRRLGRARPRPARLTLVPFGGAGPMHGSPLARDLAIPRLLVPPTPGILCALGMLVADLRHDLVQTRLAAHRRAVAPRRRARCSSRCWTRRAACSMPTGCPRSGSGSRRGSTCAISANPTNCRSRCRVLDRRSGRRWCRPSTPSTPAASATATRRRRSRSSASR